MVSDHRPDNISAPILKGQLTPTLQKDLLNSWNTSVHSRKSGDPYSQLHILPAPHNYSHVACLLKSARKSESARLTIYF